MPAWIIGACGQRINPTALPVHLSRCGVCLAWWMSNNPQPKRKDKDQ